MTRALARQPGRRLRQAGYTIVEVTIVAALTGVVMLGVFRWVTGVGSVVTTNLSSADLGTLTRAAEQISVDVSETTHCSPGGADARIRQVTPTTLVLVVEKAGTPTAVTWRIEPDGARAILQRAETPLGLPGCTYSAPAAWATWARDVDPAASVFAVVTDGVSIPAGTGPAVFFCPNQWTDGCAPDGVESTLKLAGDAFVLHRVHPLD
jgi:type II secretory pathway pseudopilin PulG